MEDPFGCSNSRLVGKRLEMGEIARRVSALEPQRRRRGREREKGDANR
jgi:hypothetical protein